MKELEMLADAIEAEGAEEAADAPTLESCAAQLMTIATTLSELVGAMKAEDPEPEEEEEEAAPEESASDPEEKEDEDDE